jgi:hypothetical protein
MIHLKVTIRRVLWTFRRNISPLSSGLKSKTSMKQAGSSDLSELHAVTTHKTVLFEPEGGGNMFLRNVGLSPNYTELQPIRPYSSESSSACCLLLLVFCLD